MLNSRYQFCKLSVQHKLLSSHAAGVLPAFLPHAFGLENTGACWLSVVYLSNNSISGSLPALWAGDDNGWRQSLQRLYLSDNKITGQLPQLWSDSNSLWKLSRLDLFGNQMTGTIPWDLANLPSLRNLVLLPGVPLHLKQLTFVALHQLSDVSCSLCSICNMLLMYMYICQTHIVYSMSSFWLTAPLKILGAFCACRQQFLWHSAI
jgi:hypothetical protein